jgi:hypothetical protein
MKPFGAEAGGETPEIMDRDATMAAIAKMRRAGVSLNDIATDLGLKKWFVSQACQRLNLTQKDAAFEKPVRYENTPMKERRCVVCREVKNMPASDWTCINCKEEQEKVDKSCWDKSE